MSEAARIIIIDDDEVIRIVLKANLESKGYVVETVGSAEEGLQRINKELFNLALIDIRLPNMLGTEILETIDKIQPNMIKLLITGHPSIDSAVEALNKSADGYIMKPFQMEELLAKIEALLERQREESATTVLKFFGVFFDRGQIEQEAPEQSYDTYEPV